MYTESVGRVMIPETSKSSSISHQDEYSGVCEDSDWRGIFQEHSISDCLCASISTFLELLHSQWISIKGQVWKPPHFININFVF